MLEVALAAHDAGLCVLPPKQDGSKRPLAAWEKYTNVSSTAEEVKQWYDDDTRTGMGVVLGSASRNLECFEFDDMDAYKEFLALADEAGLDDLVSRIEAGYLEESPNGIHWLYRCPEVAGNTKLAQRLIDPSKPASAPGNTKVMIETRGQGGFAIIAPSHGKVHPSGRPYRLLAGGVDTICEITADEHEALWNLARSMDRMPLPERPLDGGGSPLVRSGPTDSPAGERPGDWFNRTKTWPQVLEPHGWTFVFEHGTEAYWRRPGKDRDYSATTNYNNLDVFKVFSSSTPFDPANTYTKFAAYAVLAHGGDFGAAARAIFPEMPKENRHLGLVPDRHDLSAPSDREPSVLGAEHGGVPADGPKVGDSWMSVDLGPILTGDTSNLVIPTMLQREDGIPLMYPGRIHEFKGAPEAGKGWFALLACRQEIRAGNNVAYIDFEDYAEGLVERLLSMGISHHSIENQFSYFHPEEAFGDEAQQALFAEIRAKHPTLVIIDSVAEVMASNALDPLSNKDAATFVTMMPRPLANLGCAVVLIDHVTKAADNNRFSIGAQHKLAAVSGSSFIVEAENPLGVGMKGSSRILVAKDRPGRVRKHAEAGKLIGRMVVHSNEDGTLTDVQLVVPLSMTIEGMEASTELMAGVAEFVEAQGKRAPSTKEVRANVEGRNEAIDIALDALVDAGYLYRERRGIGSHFSSLKKYHG